MSAASAAFGCQICSDPDCLATFTVWVATDDTCTVNPELQVGADCVREAMRLLEGHECAIGFAQVEPLSYQDGAA